MNNIFVCVKTNAINLGLFLVAILSPIVPFVIATVLFIILDTVMGLVKAKYIGEKRNSNGFKRGFIPKMIIYTMLILIVGFGDHFLTNEVILHYTQFEYLITKIIACILIFVEAWSIDENFKAIFGFSIFAYFKKFLNWSKSYLRKLLDNESK
jgi:hypothetical protein